MIGPLFDVGLQPERTELAWRRTALSLGAGSLVSIRLLPALLDGAPWMLPGLVGVGIAAFIWVAARFRYVAVTKQLLGRTQGELPGGGLLMFMSFVTALMGCIGATVIFILATR